MAKIAASKHRDCSSELWKSPEAPVAERADDAKVDRMARVRDEMAALAREEKVSLRVRL